VSEHAPGTAALSAATAPGAAAPSAATAPGSAAAPDAPLRWAEVPTALGTLRATGTRHALVALDLPGQGRPDPRATHDPDAFPVLRRELVAYANGQPIAFTVPCDPPGTPFQHLVWEALTRIPWGETWSYGQLAAAIGRPRAVRAVAGAVGANPIAVVRPCHRVVGADGSLTGFSAGLDAKRTLLSLEGAWPRHHVAHD